MRPDGREGCRRSADDFQHATTGSNSVFPLEAKLRHRHSAGMSRWPRVAGATELEFRSERECNDFSWKERGNRGSWKTRALEVNKGVWGDFLTRTWSVNAITDQMRSFGGWEDDCWAMGGVGTVPIRFPHRLLWLRQAADRLDPVLASRTLRRTDTCLMFAHEHAGSICGDRYTGDLERKKSRDEISKSQTQTSRL